MNSDIRAEISELLKQKFGEGIEKTLKNYYEEDNPAELIRLAHHMLSGLLGKRLADESINKILKKHAKDKHPITLNSK